MKRRDALTALCGVGLGLPVMVATQEPDREGSYAPPRENDRLVFAFGERQGQVVTPGDVPLGEPQVFAYPMDPATGTIKDGTRLNQVLLIHLDTGDYSTETRARSVDGIVAYSGVCTHTGCDVMNWDRETLRFQCPCHESQFDPGDGARVVGGPAPWPLAALPLKLVDGELATADRFQGRVGFPQPGDPLFGF